MTEYHAIPLTKDMFKDADEMLSALNEKEELLASIISESIDLLAVARIADEMNFQGFNASSVLMVRLKDALVAAKQNPELKAEIEKK